VITIDDLFVIVERKPLQQLSEEEEQAMGGDIAKRIEQLIEDRLERLRTWELVRFSMKDDEAVSNKSIPFQKQIVRLAVRVIDNIQVVVRHVHMRYEHKPSVLPKTIGEASDPRLRPFAVGFTMKEFAAISIDQDGHRLTESEDYPSWVFRDFRVEQASVYLNDELVVVADKKQTDALLALQQRGDATVSMLATPSVHDSHKKSGVTSTANGEDATGVVNSGQAVPSGLPVVEGAHTIKIDPSLDPVYATMHDVFAAQPVYPWNRMMEPMTARCRISIWKASYASIASSMEGSGLNMTVDPRNKANVDELARDAPGISEVSGEPTILREKEQLQQNPKDALRSLRLKPKVDVSVEIDPIVLSLSQSQYRDMLFVASSLVPPPKEHVVRQQEAALGAFREPTSEDRDTYIALYKRKFDGYDPPSAADLEVLDRLDKELSFNTIIAFREWSISVAANELEKPKADVWLREQKEQRDQQAQEGQEQGWVDWFKSWVTPRSEPKLPPPQNVPAEGDRDQGRAASPPPPPATITDQLIEGFLTDDGGAGAEVHRQDAAELLPGEYVLKQFSLYATEIRMGMVGEDRLPMVTLALYDLNVGYRIRPKNEELRVSLSSLDVREDIVKRSELPYLLCAEDGNHPDIRNTLSGPRVSAEEAPPTSVPRRTQSHTARSRSEAPVLLIEFEHYPLDQSLEADYRVTMLAQPLDVVISPIVISKAVQFFRIPKHMPLEAFKARAKQAVARVSANVKNVLTEAFKNRLRLYLDVRVTAPTVIIPQDVTSRDSTMLVLDLGNYLAIPA